MNKLMKLSSTIILFLILFSLTSYAVAPSDEVVNIWKKDGILEKQLSKWNEFKKHGGCNPNEYSPFHKDREHLLATSNHVDTVNILVLLVDFPDHTSSGGFYGQTPEIVGTPSKFDSILFSEPSTPKDHGSMTDYYLENSYGKFYIMGKTFGWYRMDSSYTYYVGDDDGLNGSKILARDAVKKVIAENIVNFADFDYNNDGNLDGLIIIHAGPGRETLSDSLVQTAIWSHKWATGLIREDGVAIKDYIMTPEEGSFGLDGKPRLSPIGVFCHEFGHILELPDLYDTRDIDFEEKSSGLGRWSLMSKGNYSGFSHTPTHLDAWSKVKAGFVTPIVLTTNIFQAEIPQVEDNPIIYKLQNSDVSQTEYWLVENRQRTGFDINLKGEGLLIYHIDDYILNNNDPNRYRIAIGQSDGKRDLELTPDSQGDWGDVWPGDKTQTLQYNFNDLTTPDSKTNLFATSEIGVWNISEQDSLMFADLDIKYSRPHIEFDRVTPYTVSTFYNGRENDLIEPGDTVHLFVNVKNVMRPTHNAKALFETDNNLLQVINNSGLIAANFNSSQFYRMENDPIIFVMPDSIQPDIDSFFINITHDSLNDGTITSYQEKFGFTFQLGISNILIVDDDGDDPGEIEYSDALERIRKPYDIWNTIQRGTLSLVEMSKYSIVFWLTGDTATHRLDSSDIDVMKKYLDNGGNLLLSSRTGIEDMETIDPSFMSDYLSFTPTSDSNFIPFIDGNQDNGDFNGLEFRYKQIYRSNEIFSRLLQPIGTGVNIFQYQLRFTNDTSEVVGVSYSGAYKTIFLSFPIEAMDNDYIYGVPIDSLLQRAIDFFGQGFVTDVEEHDSKQIPKTFQLMQNYPNPFNPSTVISYTISSNEISSKSIKTNLSIYNLIGQKVVTLVDDFQKVGTYKVNWDGRNQAGMKVSSGIYLYRLVHGEYAQSRKMILLK